VVRKLINVERNPQKKEVTDDILSVAIKRTGRSAGWQ
jgi:hypothetical protein